MVFDGQILRRDFANDSTSVRSCVHTCNQRADLKQDDGNDKGVFEREKLVGFAPASMVSVLRYGDEKGVCLPERLKASQGEEERRTIPSYELDTTELIRDFGNRSSNYGLEETAMVNYRGVRDFSYRMFWSDHEEAG